MKDYAKIYEDKMKKQTEKALNSSIHDILEIKSIGNSKLDEIRTKMSVIVPGREKVWDDFAFRTGKIFGILRFIAQNAKYRTQLLEASGLTSEHIDIYFNICGNVPYLNSRDNSINPGRPMDVKATKEFIPYIGMKLGVVVEESDIADITQENWDRMYNAALEKITKTAQHNEEFGESIPEHFEE